ncbi:MAG: cytochrome P450 [Myxococcales bacterium]|nr:cytochrome P450 [Myxococcales bacterium]
MSGATENLPTLDLRDAAFRQDPYPALARVRAENPVHQDALGIWYVTRHADVTAALKHPRLGRDLRQWMGYAMLRPYLADSPLERCVEQWMFSLDGAEHARLRKLVARAFTPRAVAAMRASIEQAADELIAEIEAARPSELDIVSSFATPLPVRVIARVLGLPLETYDDLKEWSTTLALALEPTSRRRHREAASAAAEALMTRLRETVASRRESRADDVVSLLLAAEDGDALTEDELVSQLVLLFVAGHETTTSLIGSGMLALARHPDEQRRLRDDPSLGPSAIEEMLRYESPANTVARVVYEEVSIGGQRIGEGQMMLCMTGGANRDPDVFVDPERFDVGRSPNPHVSFGGGVHFCLGAPLARLEAQVCFERLLRAFRGFDVAPGGVEWRDYVNLRSLDSLVLRPEW